MQALVELFEALCLLGYRHENWSLLSSNVLCVYAVWTLRYPIRGPFSFCAVNLLHCEANKVRIRVICLMASNMERRVRGHSGRGSSFLVNDFIVYPDMFPLSMVFKTINTRV